MVADLTDLARADVEASGGFEPEGLAADVGFGSSLALIDEEAELVDGEEVPHPIAQVFAR